MDKNSAEDLISKLKECRKTKTVWKSTPSIKVLLGAMALYLFTAIIMKMGYVLAFYILLIILIIYVLYMAFAIFNDMRQTFNVELNREEGYPILKHNVDVISEFSPNLLKERKIILEADKEAFGLWSTIFAFVTLTSFGGHVIKELPLFKFVLEFEYAQKFVIGFYVVALIKTIYLLIDRVNCSRDLKLINLAL